MASTAARRWRAAGYVIPLVVVIGAALYWSSYSTFQHAVDAGVPRDIAWSQFVVLDGTVVVTTPIWLSTVLPRRIRVWGGLIGLLALVGSMAVNIDQFGWIGAPAPLFAGLLIHVVGLVLRAYGRQPETDPALVGADLQVEPGVASVSEVERSTPTPGSSQAEPEERKPSALPLVPVLQLAPPPPRDPVAAPVVAPTRTPQEIVYGLLDAALHSESSEPSGPVLTAAVREAGHVVNDEYGRTTKARWRTARKKVSA